MFVSWILWFLQFLIFAIFWAISLRLTWRAIVYIYIKWISPDLKLAKIISSLLTICIIFELLATAQVEVAKQSAAMAKGVPYSCQIPGKSWYDSLRTFWSNSDSCEEYYSKISSVFWKLNPLKIYVSLILDTFAFAASLLGKSFGGYFNKLFVNLPWLYHLPVLVALTLVVGLSILAYSGYEFSAFWSILHLRKPRIPEKERLPRPITNSARRPKIVSKIQPNLVRRT